MDGSQFQCMNQALMDDECLSATTCSRVGCGHSLASHIFKGLVTKRALVQKFSRQNMMLASVVRCQSHVGCCGLVTTPCHSYHAASTDQEGRKHILLAQHWRL